MAITSPYMSLTIPVTGDAATSYVASLAASLNLLDAHDHSTGKGAPIRASLLTWNATVDANAQALQNLALTRFAPQAAALSPATYPRALYSAGSAGDLYFNTNTVTLQLTANGAFNGTLLGGFGGNYVSAGAQANYTAANGYQFYTPALALANVGCAVLSATQVYATSGQLFLNNATSTTVVQLTPAVTKTYRINPLRGFTPTSQPPTFAGNSRVTCPASTTIRWWMPLPVPNFGTVSAVRAKFTGTNASAAYTATLGLLYGADSSAASTPTLVNGATTPVSNTVGNFVTTINCSPTIACVGNHFYVDLSCTSPASGAQLTLCGVEMDIVGNQLPDTLA